MTGAGESRAARGAGACAVEQWRAVGSFDRAGVILALLAAQEMARWLFPGDWD